MATLVLCELAPSDSAALSEGALPWLVRGKAELVFLGAEPGGGASRGCASATPPLRSASLRGRGVPPAVMLLVSPPADAGSALLFP